MKWPQRRGSGRYLNTKLMRVLLWIVGMRGRDVGCSVGAPPP